VMAVFNSIIIQFLWVLASSGWPITGKHWMQTRLELH
jgi:hypothetical protein